MERKTDNVVVAAVDRADERARFALDAVTTRLVERVASLDVGANHLVVQVSELDVGALDEVRRSPAACARKSPKIKQKR